MTTPSHANYAGRPGSKGKNLSRKVSLPSVDAFVDGDDSDSDDGGHTTRPSKIRQRANSELMQPDNPAELKIPEEYRAKVMKADDHMMINPKKPFRMGWDMLILMPLLMYLLVSLPFRLCFQNEPDLGSGMFYFELMIEIIFIVDIGLNFRTGYYQSDHRGEPTDDVEFDRHLVARNYVRSW